MLISTNLVNRENTIKHDTNVGKIEKTAFERSNHCYLWYWTSL